MDTKTKIIKKAKNLFATQGYHGVSMRDLAVTANISLSNTYHYFASKDALLEHIFNLTNTSLGIKRQKLSKSRNAVEMLRQRIEFQFNNAEDIVYVLKYYLTFRDKFKRNENGFLPSKAYLHIEEALAFGKDSGEFTVSDLHEDAQVMTHAINGFVLEYFPYKIPLREKKQLVTKIHTVLLRTVTSYAK